MEITAVPVNAIKLEPGGIYVLELQYKFRTNEHLMQFRAEIDKEAERLGVKFLILEYGIKIAVAREATCV